MDDKTKMILDKFKAHRHCDGAIFNSVRGGLMQLDENELIRDPKAEFLKKLTMLHMEMSKMIAQDWQLVMDTYGNEQS